MGDLSELKRLATRIVEVQTSHDVPISKLFDDFDAATSHEAVLALIAENERLERLAPDSVNAEYAGSMDLESICAERDQLKAENEALRKDAERYRWLRIGGYLHTQWRHMPDQAIDAAMGKEDRGGQSTSKTSESIDPEGSRGGGQ